MNIRLGIIILALAALTACGPVDAQQRDLFAEAQAARATADAAQAQAQFQEVFLTATAAAPIVHITETASALIVAQTESAFQKTETAAQWTPTPSPTPTPNLTATLAVSQLQAQQTQIANVAIRDNLQLEQQRSSNAFWGIVFPLTYFFVAFLTILAAIVIVRLFRYRPVRVDAHGNPVPVMDVVDGQVTSVDRNPNYRGSMRDDSIFNQWLRQKLALPSPMPALTAPRQDATTERDQMVQLVTRGLPGGNSARQRTALARMGTQQPALQAPVQVQVMRPEQARTLIGDILPNITRDAIDTDLLSTEDKHVSTD